jgi:hypothetical protein
MSTQDAQILASALATARSHTRASLLALLDETSLTSVLWGRFSDWKDKQDSGKSFAMALEERTKELAGQPEELLLLSLYGALNSITGIAPRSYAAPQDFTDNCEDLLVAVIKMAHKHDSNFTGTTLHELVQHQSRVMFGQLETNFAELDPDGQKRFMENIREFVGSLPEEQRMTLLKELRVDELSDQCLRTIITNGALGSAFAATVGVGGFSFYIGASSLLASMAGLVGITLPFGMYTALSSAIAVFANPLFLLAALGGGGYWLISGKNKVLKEKLLPMVITSLVVSDLCKETGGDDTTEKAISLWQDDWQKVCTCRELVRQQKELLAQSVAGLAQTSLSLKQAQQELKAIKNERKGLVSTIAGCVPEQVDAIKHGAWGSELCSRGDELAKLLQEINQIENRPQQDGFWRKLSSNTSKIFDLVALKVNVAKLSNVIAEQACSRWEHDDCPQNPPEFSSKITRLAELYRQQGSLGEEITRLQEAVTQKDRECAAIRQAVARLSVESAEAEKAQWGMEVLV